MSTKSIYVNSWVYDSISLVTAVVVNMSSSILEKKVHRKEKILYQIPDRFQTKYKIEFERNNTFSSFTFLLLIFAKDYSKDTVIVNYVSGRSFNSPKHFPS